MFLQTLHVGIRPEYIHLGSDGIYIRMTNLLLSPDEGLGLHVKTQVKSGRQRFVAASSPALMNTFKFLSLPFFLTPPPLLLLTSVHLFVSSPSLPHSQSSLSHLCPRGAVMQLY